MKPSLSRQREVKQPSYVFWEASCSLSTFSKSETLALRACVWNCFFKLISKKRSWPRPAGILHRRERQLTGAEFTSRVIFQNKKLLPRDCPARHGKLAHLGQNDTNTTAKRSKHSWHASFVVETKNNCLLSASARSLLPIPSTLPVQFD